MRMRPITDTMPKPLVKIAGRTLLDRGLDTLAAAGVEKAVVNVHHLPRADRRPCRRAARRRRSSFPTKAALLDSAGGIVKALPLLGPRAVLHPQRRHVLDRRRPAQPGAPGPRLGRRAHGYSADAGIDTCGDRPWRRGRFPDGSARPPLRRKERQVAPFAMRARRSAIRRSSTTCRRARFRSTSFRPGVGGRPAVLNPARWAMDHVGTPDAIAEAEEAIARAPPEPLLVRQVAARGPGNSVTQKNGKESRLDGGASTGRTQFPCLQFPPARRSSRCLPRAGRRQARAGLRAGGDPLALAAVTIYLPTRRAARALRAEFSMRSAARPRSCR